MPLMPGVSTFASENRFKGPSAAFVRIDSDPQITAVAPPGRRTMPTEGDVVVTIRGGTSTPGHFSDTGTHHGDAPVP